MYAFTRVPWVQLFFDEQTVLRVRARYVDDGATRYEDVQGGLNRMTLARFDAFVAGAGLRVVQRRDTFVRPQSVTRPLGRCSRRLRELLTNQVDAVLALSDTTA